MSPFSHPPDHDIYKFKPPFHHRPPQPYFTRHLAYSAPPRTKIVLVIRALAAKFRYIMVSPITVFTRWPKKPARPKL